VTAKAHTLVAIFLVCGAIAGGRDARGENPATAGTPVVTIGEVGPVRIEPGDTVEVRIPVTVAEGHHIQANPASGEFLVPMELSFDSTGGVSVVSVRYPEASLYRLEGTNEDLLTCHGSVVVTVRIVVAPDAPAGERELPGTLSYQACTSRRCLFPASIPVVIPVDVHA
jgi:hypothetical protein